MRKIISCLLAILLLTSCAVTAFASTTDNSSTVHYGIINSPEWSQMTRIRTSSRLPTASRGIT